MHGITSQRLLPGTRPSARGVLACAVVFFFGYWFSRSRA